MITCTQDVYGQCHLALWNETQPLNYNMQASARPSLSTRFDENSTATRASIFVPFSERDAITGTQATTVIRLPKRNRDEDSAMLVLLNQRDWRDILPATTSPIVPAG